MIDYRDCIVQQMNSSRYRDGRHERLENGQWVPWPVLTLDRLGTEEAKKVAAQSRGRAA
jgi:hypothetical protein